MRRNRPASYAKQKKRDGELHIVGCYVADSILAIGIHQLLILPLIYHRPTGIVEVRGIICPVDPTKRVEAKGDRSIFQSGRRRVHGAATSRRSPYSLPEPASILSRINEAFDHVTRIRWVTILSLNPVLEKRAEAVNVLGLNRSKVPQQIQAILQEFLIMPK